MVLFHIDVQYACQSIKSKVISNTIKIFAVHANTSLELLNTCKNMSMLENTLDGNNNCTER